MRQHTVVRRGIRYGYRKDAPGSPLDSSGCLLFLVLVLLVCMVFVSMTHNALTPEAQTIQEEYHGRAK